MYDAVARPCKGRILLSRRQRWRITDRHLWPEKIKVDQEASIELERTHRIYWQLWGGQERTILCGFSMWRRSYLRIQEKSFAKKNVDLIAANNLKVEGAGFRNRYERADTDHRGRRAGTGTDE